MLDMKIQNIQIDNCLQSQKWPVIFAQTPREQTVAAKESFEREMICVQGKELSLYTTIRVEPIDQLL